MKRTVTRKDTPLSRGIRTVLLALGTAAPALLTVDWMTDYEAGATQLIFILIAALGAGAIAYLQALKDFAAATPLGRALAQFAQQGVATLTAVGFDRLTFEVLPTVGKVIVNGFIGALIAGLFTLALALAEQE